MKLTDKDIAAIEAFLKLHQSGATGMVIIADKYSITYKCCASWSSSFVSALRKIGVEIPKMTKFNGFNAIKATELAEFRQWKLERDHKAAS